MPTDKLFRDCRPAPIVTVVLEPAGETREIPRPKTVAQLLAKLGQRPTATLVIREGELLTPDRRVEVGDTIIVRSVVSRG